MESIRIGIITMYYGSQNIGGNLQAYAMTSFLNRRGYIAEQISYNYATSGVNTNSNLLTYLSPVRIGRGIFYRINALLHRKEMHSIIKIREQKYDEFRCVIPHTSEVFDETTIEKTNQNYDVFITGSDQVWNVTKYRPAFFLTFVHSNKIKISYAASIAIDRLNEKQKKIFSEHLDFFDAISLREKESISLIDSYTNNYIIDVVDPIFLLENEEWYSMGTKNYGDEEYVLCYFLGDNRKSRRIAQKYATSYRLNLYYIPYGNGGYNSADSLFKGKKIIDNSPENIISLIKGAVCVFTDSFHATALAIILKKNFYVFERSAKGENSSRIRNLVSLFGLEEYFCYKNDRESLEYVASLEDISYKGKYENVNQLIIKSKDFLLSNINKTIIYK